MKTAAEQSRSVDLLNIGLIAISLVVAFRLPFQLFLFSYAVLGPLHYITEINWLKQKSYFVKSRKWVWLLVFLAGFLSIPAFAELPQLKDIGNISSLRKIVEVNREFFFSFFSFSFLFALTLVYVRKWQVITALTLLNLILNLSIYKFSLFSFAFVGIFLPTILHVYLFTLLFMLYGTIKNKSKAGYIACVLLLVCPVFIWFSPVDVDSYIVSDDIRNRFLTTNFQYINTLIAEFLGSSEKGTYFNLLCEAGIKIQIFVAFCYTYHYLNWFSKTSVIGWARNISKARLALLVLVWIGAMGLYWYDYQLGLTALLIMSIIHVFFEFPLNIVSVHGIVTGVFKTGKSRQTSANT